MPGKHIRLIVEAPYARVGHAWTGPAPGAENCIPKLWTAAHSLRIHAPNQRTHGGQWNHFRTGCRLLLLLAAFRIGSGGDDGVLLLLGDCAGIS